MSPVNGKKVSKPPEGSNFSTPKPNTNSEEFGVATVFPDATWETFGFSLPQGKDGVRAIANKGEVVPLESRQEMRRRDGQTRSLLRLLALPILACVKEGEWLPSPHVSGGEKEAEFANQMFRLPPQAGGMTAPLTKVVRQILLSTIDGFSAFEEVYQIPDKGPLKGKITLRKLAHRDARTIRFLVDDHGGFAGLGQIYRDEKGSPHTVEIPVDKAWYYASLEEENPFYGVSLFETAFRHYEVKAKLYFISQVAAQFAAVPGRVGKYPAQATGPQRAAFAKSLRDFAFDTALMLPDNFDVSPFQGHTGFDFLPLIEHHSLMQSKSVLMQFADKDNRMVLIENKGQDANADLFVTSLQSIMDEIAESWSIHLMPKFIDWNFGSGKYPVFRFGPLTDETKESLYSIFSTLMTATQMNSVPEFFKEIEEKVAEDLGLSVDYEAIRAEEEAEAEALDAAPVGPDGQPLLGPDGAPLPPGAEGGPQPPADGSVPPPAPGAAPGPAGAPGAPQAPAVGAAPAGQEMQTTGAPLQDPSAAPGNYEFELPLSSKVKFDELVAMASALFTDPE